jgi:hypothetical protein
MGDWEALTDICNLSPDIPFILFSGYNKEQTMEGAHFGWPEELLVKPYQLKDHSVSIHSALANVTEGKN